MTSKAFGLAQLGNAFSDGALSNRNLIINGAMQVAQRGTSFTSSGYSLDHWYIAETGTCTVIQDTADVPANFKYAMKATTSAASSSVAIYQPFEAVDYEAFKNKTVTISFYAKVNATFSGTMFVDVQTGDTADTLLSGNWAGNDPQFITPTTSWARYTAIIAVGSTNGVRFVLSPSSAQASGAEYSITGVQLEAGDTATPFEHRSYGQELALCQRYFCKTYEQDVVPGSGSSLGFPGALRQTSISTTSYLTIGNWRFPVPMRAVPTVTAYNPRTGVSNGFTGDSGNYTGVGASAIGQSGVELRVAGPLSIGTDVFVSVAATASAEL